MIIIEVEEKTKEIEQLQCVLPNKGEEYLQRVYNKPNFDDYCRIFKISIFDGDSPFDVVMLYIGKEEIPNECYYLHSADQRDMNLLRIEQFALRHRAVFQAGNSFATALSADEDNILDLPQTLKQELITQTVDLFIKNSDSSVEINQSKVLN